VAALESESGSQFEVEEGFGGGGPTAKNVDGGVADGEEVEVAVKVDAAYGKFALVGVALVGEGTAEGVGEEDVAVVGEGGGGEEALEELAGSADPAGGLGGFFAARRFADDEESRGVGVVAGPVTGRNGIVGLRIAERTGFAERRIERRESELARPIVEMEKRKSFGKSVESRHGSAPPKNGTDCWEFCVPSPVSIADGRGRVKRKKIK